MRRTAWPRDMVISETVYTDVVIAGSGMAGLYTAMSLDERLQCLIITKEGLDLSNSWLAQGGIAAAIAKDDHPEIHLEDTLVAGAGLCDADAVRALVDEGPEAIASLVSMQVPFDLREDGELQITREGGHTRDRIVHAGGDATGRETVKVLATLAVGRSNIHFLPHSFLVDILTNDGQACGVLVHDGGAFKAILARAVVLCTGGIGQVYGRHTTNPSVSTGEGLAAALRAGAAVRDMEFIQFHPTALYTPHEADRAFLISEAVRGEGGVLKNAAGRRFMADQHPMAELAPRDIVARAIVREMQKDGMPYVFLDVTHHSYEFLATRFPTITGHCLRLGIDISRDMIPVCPVQHYLVGGLKTDLNAETTLPGLYACGEVASTGVHGANRLASNSMLECLVFGRRAARHIGGGVRPRPDRPFSLPVADGLYYHGPEPEEIRRRVVAIANRDAGVIRHTAGLVAGLGQIQSILGAMAHKNLPTKAHWEALGLATVAGEILQAALHRRESVGAHFRED
ncbi:MAG: L-aspartate oxidase [Oscillospiraceae bacterium]|nr:L-aspartate oxidase [Oscillospiraceae bacterium]